MADTPRDVQTTIGLPAHCAAAGEPCPRVPDYRCIAVIGRGAFGTVWLAEEPLVGVFRAVKVLDRRPRRESHPDDDSMGEPLGDVTRAPTGLPYTSGSSAAPRLPAAGFSSLTERELAGLHAFQTRTAGHAHLIQVFKTGFCDVGDPESPETSTMAAPPARVIYYVMEVADHAGGPQPFRPAEYRPLTLTALMRRRGRLPAIEVLTHADALLDAIDHLHRAGIRHRDIKPSNILFVGGVLKLADIGLVADDRDEAVGTTAYMPPEGLPDDLYALGVVLHEMLTGVPATDFPEWPADLDPAGDRRVIGLRNLIAHLCQDDARKRLSDPAAARRVVASLTAERRVVRISRRRAAVVAAGLVLAGVLIGAGIALSWLQRPFPYERRAARTPYDGTQVAQWMVSDGFEFALGRQHSPRTDTSITEAGTTVRFWDLQTRLADGRLEVLGKFQIYSATNPLPDDITLPGGVINQIFLVVGGVKVPLYHGQQGPSPGTFGVFGRAVKLADAIAGDAGQVSVMLTLTAAMSPQMAEREHLAGTVGPVNSINIAQLSWRRVP